MSTKQDFLGSACDLGGLTIADFQETFCARCMQPECGRSQYGKSKFDQRVTTWEERLFTQVPRMDPKDPRYLPIAGQGFISIEASSGQPDWIDPKNYKSSQIVVPASVEPSITPSPKITGPLHNTPFQSGTMIGGRTPEPAKPTEDVWASPKKKTASGEKIVKPGTRIKLGG